MRILHTSDWHLGRSFHGVGMLDHQAAFVDHLVELVDAEGVDVVVVPGDLYDRALPPVDAVRVADDALTRLAASRAQVVLTSGNHDSARRLGFSARLIAAAGVHLCTDLAAVGTPITLTDAAGEVDFHAVPYLDPDAARTAWDLPRRSHEAALGEAMRRARAGGMGRPGSRSVVLAHAFVAGAEPSDSERDITVGGVSRVPVSTFDGADYVALGHLHGAHELSPRVRYSGSPLAYSFSETDHVKGSWLVDLGPDGEVDARFVPAPVPRPLARLRGELEDLLAAPGYADVEDHWLEVTLTDAARPQQAMARIRQRFAHTLVLRHEPAGVAPDPVIGASIPAGRSAYDITRDFVLAVRGAPATDAESALLRAAVEACPEDRDADPVPAHATSTAEGVDLG